MMNVGAGELLVIFMIGLIVLGPTKLPEAARQIGRAAGELRRFSAGFQQELRESMHDPVAETKSTFADPLAETKALIKDPLGTKRAESSAKSKAAASKAETSKDETSKAETSKDETSKDETFEAERPEPDPDVTED